MASYSVEKPRKPTGTGGAGIGPSTVSVAVGRGAGARWDRLASMSTATTNATSPSTIALPRAKRARVRTDSVSRFDATRPVETSGARRAVSLTREAERAPVRSRMRLWGRALRARHPWGRQGPSGRVGSAGDRAAAAAARHAPARAPPRPGRRHRLHG